MSNNSGKAHTVGRQSVRIGKAKRQCPPSDERASPERRDDAASSGAITPQMFAALQAYVAELAKRLTASEEQVTNLRDDLEERLAAERIASSRRASTSSASPT